MKRKYALAAALAGALVLPLCSCGDSAETIEKKAYEYLASRYSAEFTITIAEREAILSISSPSRVAKVL